MTALLAHTAQLRALQQTLQRLDPQMAEALHQHLQACDTADAVLRDCAQHLATHYAALRSAGRECSQLLELRHQVDLLVETPIYPLPISQIDGD